MRRIRVTQPLFIRPHGSNTTNGAPHHTAASKEKEEEEEHEPNEEKPPDMKTREEKKALLVNWVKQWPQDGSPRTLLLDLFVSSQEILS